MPNSCETYTDAQLCEAILKRNYSTVGNEFVDDKVTAIRPYAFNGCTTLNKVSCPNTRMIGRYAFFGTTIADVDLGWDKITEIGAYAFFGMSGKANPSRQANLVLPELVSLEEYAFSNAGANYAEDVHLVSFSAAKLEDIPEEAFRYQEFLETVSIPNAKTIGKYAFRDCKALSSVNFPLVTEIGEDEFLECSGLVTVNLPVLAAVPECAFKDCTSLADVTLTAALEIGPYAFQDCTALQSISLPAATVLDQYAFTGCTHLKTVKLSAAQISLGSHCFDGCSALNCLILDGCTAPPSVASSDAFHNTALGSGYIYVPSSLISRFQSDSGWSSFSARFRACEDYPNIVNSL